MNTVTSKDGTTISYEKSGQGPALVFVDGALMHRSIDPGHQQLAALLSKQFTVYHPDRRGRGDSTDTKPYSVQREIEDIEAVIEAAGGSANVYGISSGAALAFEVALALGTSKVKKLAMYEAPYNDDPVARQAWVEYRKKLDELLAQDRKGDALILFMMLVGMPEEHVAGMRQAPFFPVMEAVAPTLAYDAAALGAESAVPADKAKQLTVPTLLMDGGASYPFMHTAAVALAKVMPHAQQRTLEGQTHEVAPEALAPVLTEFFAAMN